MSTHRSTHGLDDRTVDDLLAGRHRDLNTDLDRLVSFVAELRSTSTAVPVVRPELEAVFAKGLAAAQDSVPAAATEDATQPTTRRQRMLATLSAFVATVTGKVVIGTTVAAASVGGVHAAGMVDVPGLPERAATVIEEGPAVPGAPAVDDAGDKADDRPDVDTGQPDGAGVDGDEVADRATSGEPQDDGKAFGTSIADEATEGTPAEDRPTNDEETARDMRGAPADGTDTADESKPDSTPGDGSDTADQAKPDDTATGRP